MKKIERKTYKCPEITVVIIKEADIIATSDYTVQSTSSFEEFEEGDFTWGN